MRETERQRESYRAARPLCEAVVVLKGPGQTGLQELLQSGPGQSVGPHPVHLHTQLEEQ